MPKSLTKKSEADKKDLRDAALLMRYRTTNLEQIQNRYYTYAQIAKVLRLSVR